MDIRRVIGKHIELARRERDWKQETLAEMLGASQNTISRWEAGLGSIGADDLWRLAEMFNKPIDEFFKPIPGMAAVHESKVKYALPKENTARRGKKQGAP